MRVLVVHNRYRESGGEDQVVARETALLRRHGHTVVPYELDNASIDGMNPLMLAGRTVWNHAAYRAVRRLIAHERIELVHVHNTLPLASPAVYYSSAAQGVPVVQTLHNYRLLCANALLLRDDAPCTSCVGAAPVAAVRYGCYRGSRAASAVVASMLLVHRAAGTWRSKVDTYIATTGFARDLFVAGGVPAARLVVKPHFVDPDPGVGAGGGGYALYAGRLSKEKGIETLLAAWSRLDGRVPLTIAGDGPLAGPVATAAARIPGVTWVGRRTPLEVQSLMAEAAFLVFPSLAYETFGQVIVEAYATGTPVIASAPGAAAELVEPGRTGVLVQAGDAERLAAEAEHLFSRTDTLRSMRAAARDAYESRFTAAANYEQLIAIYTAAIARHASSAAARRAPEPPAAISLAEPAVLVRSAAGKAGR